VWLARGVDAPFARLERLAETGSTNTVLREAATADPAAWPHLSAVLAAHQTSGRGRAGRQWQTPPGAALTASVLVRPHVPAERLPWLTLLAGLAVARAVGGGVGLKWPNDVLVPDAGPELPGWGTARKVGGILTELLPGSPPAAVVGIGVNLTQGPQDLPVPSATSLALAGLPAPTAPELLTAVGRELAGLLAGWEAHDGDARAAGLLAAVTDRCLTLGRPVRVDLPGAAPLHGTAHAVDDAGRLLVRDTAGREHAVLAGDVLHVRAEGMDTGDWTPTKR